MGITSKLPKKPIGAIYPQPIYGLLEVGDWPPIPYIVTWRSSEIPNPNVLKFRFTLPIVLQIGPRCVYAERCASGGRTEYPIVGAERQLNRRPIGTQHLIDIQLVRQCVLIAYPRLLLGQLRHQR